MYWERVDALEALRIAIQSEIDSFQLYRKAIEAAVDEDCKKLLAILAKEGRGYRRKLEQEYTRLSGKRLLYINLLQKRRIKRSIPPNATSLEILRIAIENKKDNRDFFEQAARRTLDPEGRKILLWLVEEEDKQLDLLQAEYNVRQKLHEGNPAEVRNS